MKKFVYLILAGLVISLSALAQQKKKQPNIVIIVSDDHAFQAISAYDGNLMQTPNIDRIANEGAIFNKAYVTNSICGPSRAVILTGKYSHKNGFKDNENSHFDGSQNSFIKELREGGYQTAWVGKWHLESNPQGFDYWQILPGQGHYYNPDFIMMDGSRERVEGYVSDVTEDVAEEWLDKRDKSKPFALVIGHKATHRTWMPDLDDMGMFDGKTFPLPANFYDNYTNREAARVQDMTIDQTMIMGYDLKMYPDYDNIKEGNITRMNADQKARFTAYYKPIYDDLMARNLQGKELVEWKYQRYMRDYLATAAALDRSIGRTLDYLDKNGLADNTIVIYVSDQGFYMGEHGWFDKRFMYEESFRTPMVMRYPGMVKPGTKSEHFVMNLDIAPTMLDAAGIPIPKDMQGESILPLLRDKKAKGREAMYYHYYENGEHSVSPHFGIKTERYKLIRFYKRVESWELYDLEKDPKEMHNLYGRKGYEKVTAKLRKQLEGLIQKYEDDGAKELLAKEGGSL
ncbi:sulfatase family protein [Pontibacter virosus]|uniref:Arylsulfatase A-like enzyme n=1 Tax=Pontibacter virosus TaxID=1765052 RepID=A0A2U1B4Z5_9BACT|nr:sulfatase [Pontibacter virosus]PVY43756.1 arylsulfatase A-like enzyme [Pontibacter virosus]